MKFPSVKQLKKEGTYEEVRIKCFYCDAKENCPIRERKERYEQSGFITRCPFTPNRPGKKKKG